MILAPAAPQIIVPDPPKIIAGPRVEIPKSRWVQDNAVRELIIHLDQEDKYGDWGALTRDELRAIEGEIRKCRKDFVYAARNYFWITNKERGEQLFSLWPSQELIYDKLLEQREKGKSQKLYIIKARQLGASTLIEGLIAWRSIFFLNINALVISYDKDHAKYLFDIMATIYDKLPWWLKPRYSSRTFESGLIFDNPSDELRRVDPGTQSRVQVKGANAVTGVGQGYRLSAVHASEASDWEEYKAREIIEEDLVHALAESVETFAIIETTPKGANTYTHKLWKRCVALMDKADWIPVYLPFFFDKMHILMPTPDQHFDEHMVNMRKRIMTEWLRCSSAECESFKERYQGLMDMSETTCPRCTVGTLRPFVLSDAQMAWMQNKRNNAGDDEDSQKKLAQEQSSTAEEAFQVSGYQVFGKLAQEFANVTVKHPQVVGFFDKDGMVHAVHPDPKFNGHCINEGCEEDHRFEFCPLRIWEFPDPKSRYYIGADVAEGLGADYSVAVVIKLNTGSGPGPTYQAAIYRSNTIGPQDFAEEMNRLGRLYNTCPISVEVNKFDTAQTWLRINCQYPELYRWKHMDSTNVLSNKWGWFTNQISRPRLWHNFRRFLEFKLFWVRSSVTAEEMKNFVKDDFDDRMVGHDEGTCDDELMATMIALWCAYEGEYDETRGYIPLFKDATPDSAAFKYSCNACAHVSYGNKEPDVSGMEMGGAIRCERCNSMRITVTRNGTGMQLGTNLADPQKIMEEIWGFEREQGSTPYYWEL